MTTDLHIHPVQGIILRHLLFKPEARFAELNTTDLTNDHFTFHIKSLVEIGLIEKTAANTYCLTPQGKEFANRFDTDAPKVTVERQAKIGIAISCVKEEKGQTYYLLQQRLKQPYYGYWGFMTGKIKWGESVEETARRELQEEMGLTADIKLVSIKHKRDYNQQHELLEDKYFFRFRGDNPSGVLIDTFEGGKNAWKTKKEIKELPKIFHDLWQGIESLDGNAPFFTEENYTVEEY